MLFYLLTCSIVILVFCIFMLFRNDWVFKLQLAHNTMVFELMLNKIGNRSRYSPGAYNEYYNCIWDYRRMLYHFWIWDLRKMVCDREKFDELVESNKWRVTSDDDVLA